MQPEEKRLLLKLTTLSGHIVVYNYQANLYLCSQIINHNQRFLLHSGYNIRSSSVLIGRSQDRPMILISGSGPTEIIENYSRPTEDRPAFPKPIPGPTDRSSVGLGLGRSRSVLSVSVLQDRDRPSLACRVLFKGEDNVRINLISGWKSSSQFSWPNKCVLPINYI